MVAHCLFRLTWYNQQLPSHFQGEERPRLSLMNLVAADGENNLAGYNFSKKGGNDTDNFVNTENCPNIHTSIDVATPIERIENNAIFSPVFLLNDNCVVEFF